MHIFAFGVEIRKMHFKVHGNLNRWPKRVWLQYALFDLAIPPQFPPHFFMIFKSCAGKFFPWLHFPQFTNISKEKEKVENGRFSEPESASTEFMPASTFPVWEKIKAEKRSGVNRHGNMIQIGPPTQFLFQAFHFHPHPTMLGKIHYDSDHSLLRFVQGPPEFLRG